MHVADAFTQLPQQFLDVFVIEWLHKHLEIFLQVALAKLGDKPNVVFCVNHILEFDDVFVV